MTQKEEKPRKNIQALQKKFQTRFTYTRMAKESLKEGDLVNAIKNYNAYLKILSEIHDAEPFDLDPALFDEQKDLSELLLISQVYWELTKIYDKTPKLQNEFQQALDQYVRFTINKPYQVLNAELLRKYMRKPGATNMTAFQTSYDKIFIESKKCYIATYCFGENDQVTVSLRRWKLIIQKHAVGLYFVKFYYSLSTSLLALSNRSIAFKYIFSNLARPILKSWVYLLNRTVLKNEYN